MGNKAKYKTPDLTVVLSVVDCLTSSVGWYDNDVTDVDWDIIDSEKQCEGEQNNEIFR